MPEPKDPISAASHQDPYPYYRRLRETQPLYFDEGCGLWVATSAAVVTAILEGDQCRIRPSAQPVPPNLATTEIAPVFSALARMTDGDYQRQMKTAIVAALSQIETRHLQAIIAEAMSALEPGRQADIRRLLSELQYRLPAYVVAQLLGINEASCRDIVGKVAPFVGAFAAGASADQVQQGCRATRDLLAMVTLASEASAPGASGLIGTLLRKASEQGLKPGQAMANALGLLMQTFDATAGLIGNGFLALTRMSEESAVDWNTFIDEVLRHDPPVQNTRRVVTEELRVAGQVLRPGVTVLLILAAANRDPAFNTDPDAFRLDRSDRRLLTFGHGRHSCPGQTIACSIAAGALESLWTLRRKEPKLSPAIGAFAYRPLPNARIPEFAA